MTTSLNKDFIIVGLSTGEVVVLDANYTPTAVVAVYASSEKVYIQQISIGQDNLSQILTLDDAGVVRVLVNAQNLNEKLS